MVQLSHLTWQSTACDTILSNSSIYFALKYGKMYGKGGEKSTLALAGINVIQELHWADKEGKEEEKRQHMILQVTNLFSSEPSPRPHQLLNITVAMQNLEGNEVDDG